MSQRKQNSRRWAVESLERRTLMAGNVAVSVTGGDLMITGDNLSNELQIVQSMQNGAPFAGRYFIAGVNGTTINGATNGFFSGVFDDIVISLNDGADRVTLTGANSNANNFIVPDDLSINTGNGSDVVTVNRISVRDDATIATGAGNDTVDFRGLVGQRPGFDGGANDLQIITGANVDNVRLRNTFVRRNLLIDTGVDNFGDVVDLSVMNIGGDTQISTGGGGDIVRLFNVGFNDDVNIATGAGNDVVRIDQCSVDELLADLGTESDRLELIDTSGRRAVLTGGANADTFFGSGNEFTEFFQAVSF